MIKNKKRPKIVNSNYKHQNSNTKNTNMFSYQKESQFNFVVFNVA